MSLILPVIVLSAQVAASAPTAVGEPERSLTPTPPVVEIFVSQACKASPPAADAIAELAAGPGVVALTWHVDYWNAMAGEKGAWRDPFAIEMANDRQRQYNERIRGRRMPITPQAVINGEVSKVGDSIRFLEDEFAAAQPAAVADLEVADDAANAVEAHAEVAAISKEEARLEVYSAEDGDIIATVSDNDAPYDAVIVEFHPYTETIIEAGDNAGGVFREVNTVFSLAPLGVSVDGAASFRFDRPKEGNGCAVLVQEPGQGRIIAAQYCP